jgi:hypothetical protein
MEEMPKFKILRRRTLGSGLALAQCFVRKASAGQLASKLKTMKLTIERKELDSWLELVQSSKLTFFKVRQEVFDKLLAILRPQSQAHESTVTVTSSTFKLLKSYLTSRNDKLSDEKTLAFEKTLEELEKLVESDEEMHLSKAPARSELRDVEMAKDPKEGKHEPKEEPKIDEI